MEIRHAYTNAVLATVPGETLEGADLQGADLRGADLQGANLVEANLRGANLGGAYLRKAKLVEANLGGALNITPSVFGLREADETLPARIARLVLDDPDRLRMEAVHTCETTHCLAGWAIHLSGPAGYALAAATSWSVAGAMLLPSAAHLFYSSDDEALAWLREQV